MTADHTDFTEGNKEERSKGYEGFRRPMGWGHLGLRRSSSANSGEMSFSSMIGTIPVLTAATWMGGGNWLRMLPLECCLCVVPPSGSVTGVSEDGMGGWSGAESVLGSFKGSLSGSPARSGVRSGAVGVEVEEGSGVRLEGQGCLAWRSR